MKKREMERMLKDAGFWLKKEGSKHDIWTDGAEEIALSKGATTSWTTLASFKSKMRKAMKRREQGNPSKLSPLQLVNIFADVSKNAIENLPPNRRRKVADALSEKVFILESGGAIGKFADMAETFNEKPEIYASFPFKKFSIVTDKMFSLLSKEHFITGKNDPEVHEFYFVGMSIEETGFGKARITYFLKNVDNPGQDHVEQIDLDINEMKSGIESAPLPVWILASFLAKIHSHEIQYGVAPVGTQKRIKLVDQNIWKNFRKVVVLRDKKIREKSEQHAGVHWYNSVWIPGHWRREFVPGTKEVNLKFLGKDRDGKRVVPGYTWVTEHVRGDGPLMERVWMVEAKNPSLKPPKAASKNALRGLKLRHLWGRGGTAVGVARARDLVNGKNLSEETIRRMASFNRHRKNSSSRKRAPDGGPTAGYIAWLLWGGDAGVDWALRKREKKNPPKTPSALYQEYFVVETFFRCSIVPFMLSKHTDAFSGQMLAASIHAGLIDKLEKARNDFCALTEFEKRGARKEAESGRFEVGVYGELSPISDSMFGDLSLARMKKLYDMIGFDSVIEDKTLFVGIEWVDPCSEAAEKNINFLRKIEQRMKENGAASED